MTPEFLEAMPDAELILNVRRLRTDIASLTTKLAESGDGSFGRRPDWTLRAQARLKELQGARQQVLEEGMRRVRAAREMAT